MSDSSLRGSKSILVTFIVLIAASFAWSTSARLERQVWVRFDGQGLLVHDQFSTGIRYPQRLSVREPLRLESAAGEIDQQVVLTSIEPGERGFPVGGTATVFLESTVSGSIWYSFPISPAGWDVANAEVAIHTGPGWKVLATTGGGTGAGAWLDEWTPEHALGVLCLAAMIGFAFGWRSGMLALAGFAMAGDSAIDPKFLYGASLVVCLWGSRRWMRPSWGTFSGGLLSIASIAAAGWLVVFAWIQILSIVDPVRHLEAVDETGDVTSCSGSRRYDLSAWSAEGMMGKDRFADRKTVGGVIGGILTDGAGFETDYRHLEAWIPEEDSSYHQAAHPSTGDPLWDVTSACREWREKWVDSPMDSTGHTATRFDNGEDDSLQTMPIDIPGVAAKQKMGLLVLPPLLTGIWRILSVVLLGIAFASCLRKSKEAYRRLMDLGKPSGLLLLFFVPVFCGAGGAQAAGTGGMGSIERHFRFAQEWKVVTKIEEIRVADSVVRIPLLPGEVPIDRIEIQDGSAVVSRKRFTRLVKYRGGGSGTDVYDSLYSGSWKGLVGFIWYDRSRIAAGWTSRLEPGSDLTIHADEPGGWEETWRAFVSERWHLRFQGMRLSGKWDASWGRSMVFHPRPSDSLRVLFQKTRKVSITKTKLNEAHLEFRDPFLQRARLHLRFNVADEDTVRIGLPDGASEVTCTRDGRPMEQWWTRDGKLYLPVERGASEADIRWMGRPQTQIFRRSPPVTISVDGVNESIRIPDQVHCWIPVLHGPGVGPSESGWMGSVAFGLVSLLLTLRWRHFLISVDLVVAGLCTSFLNPWFALAFGMVVFLYARRVATGSMRPFPSVMENGRQWTWLLIVPVSMLICRQFDHLVVLPSTSMLEWYTDTAGPELMRPWMIVLPGWAWMGAVIGSIAWLVSLGVRIALPFIALLDHASPKSHC